MPMKLADPPLAVGAAASLAVFTNMAQARQKICRFCVTVLWEEGYSVPDFKDRDSPNSRSIALGARRGRGRRKDWDMLLGCWFKLFKWAFWWIVLGGIALYLAGRFYFDWW